MDCVIRKALRKADRVMNRAYYALLGHEGKSKLIDDALKTSLMLGEILGQPCPFLIQTEVERDNLVTQVAVLRVALQDLVEGAHIVAEDCISLGLAIGGACRIYHPDPSILARQILEIHCPNAREVLVRPSPQAECLLAVVTAAEAIYEHFGKGIDEDDPEIVLAGLAWSARRDLLWEELDKALKAWKF